MRKLILSLALAILFAVLVVPVFVGFWAEKRIPQYAHAMLKAYPNLKVQIKAIDRGWFSTSVKMVISEKSLGINMPVTQEVKQGPFIFYHDQSGTHFVFAKAVLVPELSGSLSQIKTVGILNWNDTVHTTFSAKQLIFNLSEDNQHMKIVINNLKGSNAFNYNSQAGVGDASIQSMIFSGDTNSPTAPVLAMNGLSLNMGLRLKGSLWFGHYNINLDSISANAGNQSIALIKQVALKSQQNLDNGKINGSIHLSIGSQQLPKQINIKNFGFDLSIKGLDEAAAQTVVEKMRSINNDNADALAKEVPPLVLQLIAQGFSVNTSLALAYNDNPIKAHATINLAQLNNPTWPQVMLSAAAEGRAVIPKALAMQAMENILQPHVASINKNKPASAPKMTAPELAQKVMDLWIQRKMIIEQGDNVVINFSLKNMQPLINGQKPDFGFPKAKHSPT